MNPELRFKDQDGKDFPDWEEKKIKEIGRVTMCKRIFKDQTLSWGEIPFFKIGWRRCIFSRFKYNMVGT